jgi:hypothetical protein
MSNQAVFDRVLEIQHELAKIMDSAARLQECTLSGEDQLLIRQLALLLYLVAKPKTQQPITEMRQLVVGMDLDFQTMLDRLVAGQGL